MTVTNTTLLDAYATISQLTYEPNQTTPDVSAGSFGTYRELNYPDLGIPTIDGAAGFQARAFFNDTNNELVIAFAGTEGASDLDTGNFLPDFLPDLSLAVTGASSQS